MLLLLIQALSFCVSSAESGPAVLELELPVYGSVYMCDDYNFMVVGQNNTEEGDTKEVFRIIRYSKDRERQSSRYQYHQSPRPGWRPDRLECHE